MEGSNRNLCLGMLKLSFHMSKCFTFLCVIVEMQKPLKCPVVETLFNSFLLYERDLSTV